MVLNLGHFLFGHIVQTRKDNLKRFMELFCLLMFGFYFLWEQRATLKYLHVFLVQYTLVQFTKH